jgi:hypothetical protein
MVDSITAEANELISELAVRMVSDILGRPIDWVRRMGLSEPDGDVAIHAQEFYDAILGAVVAVQS